VIQSERLGYGTTGAPHTPEGRRWYRRYLVSSVWLAVVLVALVALIVIPEQL
jgi:hypothetical protein